ncbi:type VII secretion-associated serine protease mycosin [Spirilliplanes yamanashiensis]|uniref:Type VII secretion-associated serine protease n=1 Tax=Spirilliplanes yamanashiensis TaxID=42233 RepID=A0A8J3Y3J5_9ACTN|nr:type VII secretion-associated serine protease mycosin [Spirilliplanes yamanashiensis]MDP9814141.1 type VII secretion-associated serine protease mycosin [Spirilliplanes yamanashiensis]GIJ00877.1 type VII secretion-associated serine protease [Spirilliplanes yamanashiensis]
MRRVRVIFAFSLSILATLPPAAASADKVRDGQWHLKALAASRAHTVSKGSGVVVAVVDTGIDPHRDLAGQVLTGTTIIPGDSGDGREDQDSHGTQMAGLIAGRGRASNAGVLGIAPEAKLLPIKIQNKEISAGAPAVGRGIKIAIDRGASIVNVSYAVSPDDEIDAAVAEAAARDVLIVAGIGNTNLDIVGGYPAAMPGVLAVGGSDRGGDHSEISIRDRAVLICAPADEIVSTGPKNQYRIGTGTSNSTAIVSGAAALIRSKFPSLTAREVIHRLTATADDNGPPGRDDECGYGVVNIVKALTADVPPLAPSTAPSPSISESATTSPTANASTETDPKSNNTPLIAGGLVGSVAVIGGLVAFLLVRRRRGDGTYP